MHRTIKTTETAKIIRKELKRQFPQTKFRVLSNKNGNNGCSGIDIFWEDGYTESEVLEAVKQFRRYSVNLKAIDYRQEVLTGEWEGELICWDVSFIDLHREYSDEFDEEIYCLFDSWVKYLFIQHVPEYFQALEKNIEYSKKYGQLLPYFVEVRAKYYQAVRAQVSEFINWKSTRIVVDFERESSKVTCDVPQLSSDGYEQSEVYYLDRVTSVVFQFEGYEGPNCVTYWDGKDRYSEDCFSPYRKEVEVEAEVSLDELPIEVSQDKPSEPQLTPVCSHCKSTNTKIHVLHPKRGNPRYKCKDCFKTFTGKKIGRPLSGDRPKTSAETSRDYRAKQKRTNRNDKCLVTYLEPKPRCALS